MASQSGIKYNLTEGGILQKLLLVAVPLMGSSLVQMAYNLTDMFWLGRLGSNAVAASGTAGMYMWLSMSFMMVGRMGTEIGVSQSLGRGDPEAAKSYTQNSLAVAAALGVLYAAVMIVFRNQMIGFYGIREADVVEGAVVYLTICSTMIPATFIAAVMLGAFNASGNSRVGFQLNVVGLIVNVVLDPVLIFTFDMDIAGAAYATIASQFVVFLFMIVAMKRHGGRPFRTFKLVVKPEKEKLVQIVKWAAPIGLENMLFTACAMLTSRFEAAFGAGAISLNRIGSQIESLSWMISGGFGSALTAFVGQNFGAGKQERIERGVRVATQSMVVWGAVVTVVLVFWGQFLFSLFLPDPELVELSGFYMQIIAICQIPICLEAVAGGGFKGEGRTVPPAIVSIVSNVIRVPTAYLLSRTSLGMYGIWLGVTIGSILRGVWMYVWYALAARKQKRARAEAAALARAEP